MLLTWVHHYRLTRHIALGLRLLQIATLVDPLASLSCNAIEMIRSFGWIRLSMFAVAAARR
jgi:hypothetical protein